MTERPGLPDSDVFVLIITAGLIGGVVIDRLPSWPAILTWLTQHHILTTTDHIVAVPGTSAGLDLPRIVIVATAIALPALLIRFIRGRRRKVIQ